MPFDLNNPVVTLCAKGMEMEGLGKPVEAKALFNEAWGMAATPFEKCTAAHYVARHQLTLNDKLKWDKTSLEHALLVEDESMKGTLPSLYLNIGKCYEDLDDVKNAARNYEFAFSFFSFLPGDGYGNMIRSGIRNGLKRVKSKLSEV